MSSQQIIQLIKSKESDHYKEYRELLSAFGRDNPGTKNAIAAWHSLNSLLEEIENNTTQSNKHQIKNN